MQLWTIYGKESLRYSIDNYAQAICYEKYIYWRYSSVETMTHIRVMWVFSNVNVTKNRIIYAGDKLRNLDSMVEGNIQGVW
jgi:hypothetical protein